MFCVSFLPVLPPPHKAGAIFETTLLTGFTAQSKGSESLALCLKNTSKIKLNPDSSEKLL